MIPQSFIQDLLNRVDIVDVVESYIPLKKAGANYAACCPFHGEKTPSFTVSQSKQFYHCFGCGAHGSAIGFVMEYAGLGFVEAVKELAENVGMPVPDEKREEYGARKTEPGTDDLYEIMRQAMQFYRAQLKQSDTAIAYLKKRGLSGEIAARFGIGYAPGGWQNLAAVFADYNAPPLLQCGLVIENDEGKRYDRFRDRIMFPIQNQRGMVIGFGGRVLGQGEPKYLNSPETPLFEKGLELYGLPQARKAIRDAGKVLVVEGYMDVVALAQHGVEYAVATLGTATTPMHVQKLLKQSDEVVFCFDGDNAGRRAAWRALENSLAYVADGKNLAFLFLPQGEDPDSYVRQLGKEGFEALLRDEALSLSGFLLKELVEKVEMQTQEGRAKLLELARPLLAQIKAPTMHLMLRKRIAELAGISQAELEDLFQIKRDTQPAYQASDAQRGEPMKQQARRREAIAQGQKARRQAPSLSRKLLQLLVFQPQLAVEVLEDLPEDNEGDLACFNALLEFLRSNPHIITTPAVLEHFRNNQYSSLLGAVAGEVLEQGNWDVEEAKAEFSDGIHRLRELARNKRLDVLRKQAGLQGLSPEEKREFQELVQRRV